MVPTIRDVAKKASVSIATVSRVVNNPEKVKADTRERVLAAISELSYEPNPFASGLRDNKTKTIVAVIPDTSNPFYAQMFRGIEDTARSHLNNVIICNTDRDEQRFLEYMNLFRKKKVDGIIFASETLTEAYYEGLESLHVPTVLVATSEEKAGYPYVKVNEYQAGMDAAKLLLASGHEQLGIISGPKTELIADNPKLEGFLDAATQSGVLLTDEHIEYADLKFDGAFDAMSRLHHRVPSLTAVFALSDTMAIGALAFLQRSHISVPGEVSVLGFDNLELSRMVNPPLSTVHQPIYSMGQEATEMLIEWINTGIQPNSVLLPHQILERETVLKRNKSITL